MENPYAAPRAEILTPTGTQAPLTWKQILFSFEGRIPRRTYWGTFLVVNAIVYAIVFAAESALESNLLLAVLAVIYIPTIWIGLAISAKRWHDRDKSAWWILFAFVPIIGALWSIIECGFLRGTMGPNKFGEDQT